MKKVMRKKEAGFTLIELMIVLAIIAITATLVISNLASSRISANETSAIKTCRAIQEAASVFKKQVISDVDTNGVGEYPSTFASMVDGAGNSLIGLVATLGIQHGYTFAVAAGGTTPENTCYADGTPQAFGGSGNRTFLQASDGIGYHSPNPAAIVPAEQNYLVSDGGTGAPSAAFAVVQE